MKAKARKHTPGKNFLIAVCAGALGGWIGAHITYAITSASDDIAEGAIAVVERPQLLWASISTQIMPPMTDEVAIVAILLAVVVFMAMAKLFASNANTYRQGEEGGSAKWGTLKAVRQFANLKQPEQNLILSKNIKLAFNTAKVEFKRNLNVFVVGGPGSGKTEFLVKPNILNLFRFCNLFINDPKGTVIATCGRFLAFFGVKIRQFNTVDFSRSSKFNPFVYIKDDVDLMLFIDNFMANTNPGDSKNSSDPFWDKSERMFYMALCALMRDYFDRVTSYSFPALVQLVSMAKVEDGEQSELDMIFQQIEKGTKFHPNDDAAGNEVQVDARTFIEDVETGRYIPSAFVRARDGHMPGQAGPDGKPQGTSINEDIALSCWQSYRDAPDKTRDCILVCAQSRLKALEIPEVQELLSEDEMNLYDLTDPDKKVAIFNTASDINNTFGFLSAIMIAQTIEILNQTADIKYGGSLPKPVGLFIDELPNQFISGLERVVATCRSRNFFLVLIAQSVAQMEVTYDKNTQTIFDCCDSFTYLGGKSTETNEQVSKMIGKETFMQTNISYGKDGSATRNVTPTARDLIDPAELSKMSKRNCVVLISGTDPHMDAKYYPWEHENYKYINPGHASRWVWKGLIPRKVHAVFDEDFDYIEYLQNEKREEMLVG